MDALQRSLKLQLNPFRFLLYAEWMMIATCFSFAIMEFIEGSEIPVQHILVLTILSVMAAILPSGKLPYKLLYVGVEIGLIFYGATLGYLHVLPTLYLIVLIQSCFLFKPPIRWAIAGLSSMLFLVHQVRYVQNITLLVEPSDRHLFWMHLIAETLMFGLGLFFVLKLVSTLLSERQAKEQLAAAHEQLRQYALQIEELAAVQERNHIAREIHDSLGHTLTAQNIQLQTAAKLWQRDPNKAHSFLQQAQQLAATVMQEVRRSVRALREDVSEEPLLEEAIAHLAKDFQQGTGIAISTSINGQIIICSQMSKTLHRIVQESLTNIRKHTQATQVNIQLSTTANDVRLVIEDDSQGFDPNRQSTNGFGLQGMRERVAAANGILYLETSPGTGCRIAIKLPLQNNSERTKGSLNDGQSPLYGTPASSPF